MKILYITNGVHGSGGLERVLSVKANYLVERYNYNVAILTLNSKNKNLFYQFSDKIAFYNINVKGNPLSYIWGYRKQMINVINKFNPEVISVCDDGLKGLLFPLFFKINIPIIYERHASVFLNFANKNISWYQQLKNRLIHKLMIAGAKSFDRFVMLTNGNKLDWKGVDCTVIPNPNPFTITTEFPTNKKKHVLSVGSKTYNKGYDRLIEIWDLVKKKDKNWILKIFGKSNADLDLQKLVYDKQLSNSILLKPPIKDIQNEYKKASIYVLPSRSEGFGMVLIEAMSFGVPCVAFDCPHGPADIITHGEDGFLIKNGDCEAFADAITTLIEDKELRKKMGEKAIQNVQRYSVENIMKKWDKLFKELVA